MQNLLARSFCVNTIYREVKMYENNSMKARIKKK